MDNKKIGKLIAQLRKEKGLTQQQLGDRVGVGSRAVSKWECGLTVPDISIINELSNILGITPKELLSGKLNQTKTITSKTKLTTKFKIISLSITILIISVIFLFIYYNNKTYVYDLAELEHEKFKIEGYASYKKGILSLYISNFEFNEPQYINLKIKDFQYYLQLDDQIILGYGQTQEDVIAQKKYIMSNVEEILKISYTGETKLSQKELLEKNVYILLTLWDDNNNEFFYEIGISFIKKEK